MASLAAIAAAIAAVVGPVNGGAVTSATQPIPARRAASGWTAFLGTWTVPDGGRRLVRATSVAYRGETREARTVALGAALTLRRTRWSVRHLEAWTTDSEGAFRDRLEAMAGALDAARSLGGTVTDHGPVAVKVEPDGVFLANLLCHAADLSFEAWHEEAVATS